MQHLLFTLLIVCLTAKAWGQTAQAPAWPQALSLPWNIVGIDPARTAPVRAALRISERALAAACLDAAQTLSEFATTISPLPLNARRLADQIRIGQPKTAGGLVALAIEPLWTSLHDHDLFAVTVADAARNVLLGAAHTTIAKTQWPNERPEEFLTEQLTNLANRALAQAAAHPLANPDAMPADALHLSLGLGRESQRQDLGDDHSLNLLLEEALAPRYTVVRSLGGEALAAVRQILKLPSTLRRPTRALVARWSHLPEVVPVAIGKPAPAKSPGRPAETAYGQKISRPDRQRAGFPAQLQLKASFAETVHGEHLADRHQSSWEFTRSGDGRISFTIPPELEALLERERKSLLAKDLPLAIKIDRAWVYVDRGRAWGLKIGDRLIARVGPEPDDLIKGHIVQYFGPELKLSSPRGFPIQEGAVIFIRTNQAKARPGIVFEYDPKTYPSPWPPRPP